ncbi:MAG: hypothetical protein JNJ50_08730 [Acidobacteria bacterium]|nr:hypothetical protein [Acidobacteriota bacterium]
MAQYKYEIFADYFQFYLQDEDVDGNLSDSWTKEAVDNLLALAPGTIGIGTARNMTVPVTVEILDSALDKDDLSIWDQVNECSIEVGSGRIVIAGCTDYFPEAARISVTPGMYRARIYYGNLESLRNYGSEGDDHYKVVLWPAEFIEQKYLKQHKST